MVAFILVIHLLLLIFGIFPCDDRTYLLTYLFYILCMFFVTNPLNNDSCIIVFAK